MDPIFKKMNFKAQTDIWAINAPESFEANLEAMKSYAAIHRSFDENDKVGFAVVFVTKQAEIDELVPKIVPLLDGDALLWFCYPKGTSKNYKCDFNRDTGWSIMGQYDLEGVRMVAVDADWSALRFRNVKYIKKLTRSKKMALSDSAKKRTSGK